MRRFLTIAIGLASIQAASRVACAADDFPSIGEGPDTHAQLQKSESERWGKVVNAAGIKTQSTAWRD